MASNFENRDITQLIRFQFWLTSGMIIKAVNEEYTSSGMSTAIAATILLCGIAAPHLSISKRSSMGNLINDEAYFEKLIPALDIDLEKYIVVQHDKDSAKMISKLNKILFKINVGLAALGGETIEKQKSVEI